MQKTHANVFLILVSTVAFIAMAITPALAKDSEKKKSTHSSAKTAGPGFLSWLVLGASI